MIKKFVPLDIGLIDEGQLVADAADEFAALQSDLIAYKEKHGEKAEGAKAKFSLEITLSLDPPIGDDQVGIVSQIKRVMPARPSTSSRAYVDQTDNGQGALFVRASGSSAAAAKQAALCTQAGETIDLESGEVLDPKV